MTVSPPGRRPYRGYQARSDDLTRKRPRPRRTEILNAIEDGHRRLLGRRQSRQLAEAAAASPVITGLRADFRANVLAAADLIGRAACWDDGTVIYPREQLCERLGICLSTWKAIRRVLRRAGLLFLVTPGRKYWHGEHTRSDAAVYVITAPMTVLRKIRVRRRRATAFPISRPPTVQPEVSNLPTRANEPPPEREGPPSGRTPPEGRPRPGRRRTVRAAGAVADALRKFAGQSITDGWVSYLTAILEAHGWSGADVDEALAWQGWNGRRHPYLHKSMRHPDVVLRHRLMTWWFDAKGSPLPSPSQRRAAAAERQRAEQARAAAAGITTRGPAADPAGRVDQLLAQLAGRGVTTAAALLRRRREAGEGKSARPPP